MVGGVKMKRSQISDYRQILSIEDLHLSVKNGELVLPDGGQWCYTCDNPAHECNCDWVWSEGNCRFERIEED